MSKEAAQAPPPTLMRTMLNLLPLIIVTLYLCQNRPDKDPKYVLDQCAQQLHKIGVSIEKDRLLSEAKLYNTGLKEIFGKHPIPACPEGGEDSYINGYTVAGDKRSYLLVCKGDHHVSASVPSDFPRIAFSVEEAEGNGAAKDDQDTGTKPASSPTPGATVESEGQPEDAKAESERAEAPKLQSQDPKGSTLQEQSLGEEQKGKEPQAGASPAATSSPQPE
jgi:hypothetical protein